MPNVYTVLFCESFESTPLIFIIRTIHLFGTLELAIFSLHNTICLVGNYKLTPLEDLLPKAAFSTSSFCLICILAFRNSPSK